MSQAQWQNELRIPAALARDNCASFAAACGRSSWSKRSPSPRSACSSLSCASSRSIDSSIRRLGAGEQSASAALVGCCAVPWFLHHWVWRFRRLDQLARLLSRKMPRIGDQLLGIIELAQNRWEQTRSRALCQAAIEQVSDDAQHRDFRAATPNSRLRTWLVVRGHAAICRRTAGGIGSRRGRATPGRACSRLGAIRHVTHSRRSSRCQRNLSSPTASRFTLTAKLAADSPGSRPTPALNLANSRRSTPSWPTAAIDSNSRRKSMPDRCTFASAMPRSEFRSNPSCGRS